MPKKYKSRFSLQLVIAVKTYILIPGIALEKKAIPGSIPTSDDPRRVVRSPGLDYRSWTGFMITETE